MITETTQNIKCDVRDCKNTATCFIAAKGRVGKFFLCKDCCQKLAKSLAPARPPKSPKNTIKRIIDQKAEENT